MDGIVKGKTDPGWLADYAKGSLRGKREELELALRGNIREHHRYLLAELWADLDFICDKIVRLEAEIAGRMEPHVEQATRSCTIRVDILTAWTWIAERV